MNTACTSFRFPRKFLDLVDRYAAKKARETGGRWSRAAAVMFLVRSALEHEDVQARGKKS